MGSSASAASAASATSMPAGCKTAPVVTMMNQAMAQAMMEPVAVSMRCSTMPSSLTFLSTTLFCARKIIHGAMVVPMVATSSETYCGSFTRCGVTVARATSPQLGPARNAATI